MVFWGPTYACSRAKVPQGGLAVPWQPPTTHFWICSSDSPRGFLMAMSGAALGY